MEVLCCDLCSVHGWTCRRCWSTLCWKLVWSSSGQRDSVFVHIHVFKQQQQNKTFQQEGSSLHPPFRWLKKAVRCLPSALLFSELGRVPSASPDVPRATWAPWWQRGNVFTVLGSPELATGLQSHQCWVEGDHHFPCTLANTAQGVAVFTAKRHCLLMLNLSTSTPRTSAANLLSGYSAPACPAAWGFFSSDAGLCICCSELHDVLVSPSLRAVKVPLHSSLALRHTSYSSKFSIIR